ncbi:hypothetical protein [Mucilaginibacter psychrotolerans]|uniref:Glycoside hydrolase family 42 N-terminal domain-containing protein n=1 Tax=Mucilaginibacter psychrotolerans TaxID=1524096 RepID=A0A4Y8SKS4_9SPHI|nr:hypothetical protein [Mucilaginibacter psychrotolerans]TFF39240.1 hypothetical protein E2R66_06365 [Mucilaginibacter psychrotolerans]
MRTIPAFVAVLLLSGCNPKASKIHVAKIAAPIPEGSTINLRSFPAEVEGVPLRNMFGVNGYEWNFLENPAAPKERGHIYEDNMALIKCFSGLRHYMNWNKLENTQGNYTFNPTNNGSWDYDLIYTRCKQDSILVLANMKNLPVWMMNTYPAEDRNDENVPVFYGADIASPASYVVQARTAFQFAARYGANTAIDPKLVKVDTRPRWAGDKPNQVKIGLGLIKYIECGNENDRWWKGDKATQTPEQYAANLSAFYDGHKGTLGNNAGVKTADPTMQVLMTGLATADVNYLKRMVAWCKTNRGYKPDGSINLCFDIINYHLYANDGSVFTHTKATTGIAPELSDAGRVADSFVKYADSLPGKPEVWVTETGYDINPGSYQRAPAIGNKSALQTQADWILRSSLLYARHGVKRLFFYQLFDAFAGKEEQYATSGLAQSPKRRPAADYILQTRKLLDGYVYTGTIGKNPLIDKFEQNGKVIYAVTIPEQSGQVRTYTLNFGAEKTIGIYKPKAGAENMAQSVVKAINGKLTLQVSETPLFLQLGD